MTPPDAQPIARHPRRGRPVRTVLARGSVYVVLLSFMLVVLFPFVYMAATALKTPADTFRYPPKILPRTPSTADVGGEHVELFSVEAPGAGTVVAYLAESGLPAGVFAIATDVDKTVLWPLDQTVDTGEVTIIDGETYPLYDVALPSGPQRLALLRNTAVGRFVSLDDASIETFAVVRTTIATETVDYEWENFEQIVTLRDFDRPLTNTILVTLLVVAGTLFTSITGGYAFSRINFVGRDKIFVAYIGSIMIPFIVLIVPLFRLMVSLGWVNTLGSLVWPFIFNAYGTFLMRQFFESIPKDLEEAALIDGASRWKILWGIFVPLSWPAIATLATFMFLYAWNSFIWPLVSINLANSDDFVLTLALQTLGGQAGEGPNLVFAAIVLSVMIPFTVFVMAQRYFVENVATSGIK